MSEMPSDFQRDARLGLFSLFSNLLLVAVDIKV